MVSRFVNDQNADVIAVWCHTNPVHNFAAITDDDQFDPKGIRYNVWNKVTNGLIVTFEY